MQKPEQVTRHNSNNQLLYFTSTSLLKDNMGLVFISDRNGFPNLFYKNLQSGEERQLTHQTEGYLRSYVYFDGLSYRGFGKASVSLHAESGTAYYLQGQAIMCVQTNGESRQIATLPDGQLTGFTHISADNRYLCVPTVDEDAFHVTGPLKPGIDDRIHEKNLSSYLRVYDVQNGEQVLCEQVPRCWITHVQFCPTDSSKILYNHEWCNNSGVRRMWLFDGTKHIQLRTLDSKRLPGDWACHEMWEKDGKHVIYHGGHLNGPCFIGRLNIEDLSYHEIDIPTEYKPYGHFTVMDSGTLVSDGYYGEKPSDFLKNGQFISMQTIDWEKESIVWKPLCRHESNWDCQCSHPHPIFDHGDAYIYFTSNPNGKRQIYRVKTGL